MKHEATAHLSPTDSVHEHEAKITHEAEQTKCKMVESYTLLLLAPTDQLNADALAERKMALESMRLALFPKVLHCQSFFI
jgi:hypothetical protein